MRHRVLYKWRIIIWGCPPASHSSCTKRTAGRRYRPASRRRRRQASHLRKMAPVQCNGEKLCDGRSQRCNAHQHFGRVNGFFFSASILFCLLCPAEPVQVLQNERAICSDASQCWASVHLPAVGAGIQPPPANAVMYGTELVAERRFGSVNPTACAVDHFRRRGDEDRDHGAGTAPGLMRKNTGPRQGETCPGPVSF